MTDTAVSAEATLADSIENSDGNLVHLWELIRAAIDEKDEQLDALNPEVGVKRAFLNDLDSEYGKLAEDKVTNVLLGQLNGYLEEDPRKAFGIYLAISSRFRKAFQKKADEWVEAQVEALPKPEAADISEDEKKALSAKRSEYYGMAKQTYDLATKLLPASMTEGWEMPKIRRGGSGKRGKRALYSYTWAINGEGLPEDDDNPKGVAAALGYDKVGEFTADLRNCLVTGDDGKKVKLNTTKPPREFEVTLKDKTITATKVDDANGDDDEDESDEDTSDED